MAIIQRLQGWLIGALAAISALIGIYLYGRQQGSLREAQRAAENDRKNARKIEDFADNARAITGDPIDRLRKSKRLRD